MAITIKLVDPIESFDEAIPLLKANWKDSGNPFDFNAADTKAFYTRLSAIQIVCAFAAYEDDALVGYCVAVIHPHPLNNSIKICDVNGIYLIPRLRKGSTTMKMTQLVTLFALEADVNYIHWHAPANSEFSRVLASRHEPISNYFREALKHGE